MIYLSKNIGGRLTPHRYCKHELVSEANTRVIETYFPAKDISGWINKIIFNRLSSHAMPYIFESWHEGRLLRDFFRIAVGPSVSIDQVFESKHKKFCLSDQYVLMQTPYYLNYLEDDQIVNLPMSKPLTGMQPFRLYKVNGKAESSYDSEKRLHVTPTISITRAEF